VVVVLPGAADPGPDDVVVAPLGGNGPGGDDVVARTPEVDALVVVETPLPTVDDGTAVW
jgi:hypothetical protein